MDCSKNSDSMRVLIGPTLREKTDTKRGNTEGDRGFSQKSFRVEGVGRKFGVAKTEYRSEPKAP